MFQVETQGTIRQGQSLNLQNYTITFRELAEFDTDDARNVARAVVSVTKNGQPMGNLYPRRDFYYEAQQSMTIPGVRSTMEDDLYVLLVDWESISSAGVTFKIFRNPLVNWLWVGGLIFILGTLVAAWPDRDPETVRERAAARTAVSRA